eukprot:8344277-Pyramimonas_sp.AAC.1
MPRPVVSSHGLNASGGRLGAILGRHGALCGQCLSPLGPSWGSPWVFGMFFGRLGMIFDASRAFSDARNVEQSRIPNRTKNNGQLLPNSED